MNARWYPSLRRLSQRLLLAVVVSASVRCGAFALLGPYAEWMQPSNSFRLPADIGGPMNVGEEYRWNVPVLTYGFDQSFLDYFGTNGVAAVSNAFAMLNELPPASVLNVNNFSNDTLRVNYRALADGLYDLRSETLVLMMEQLGLAAPQRFMYSFQSFLNPPAPVPSGYTPEGQVLQRNFDPVTLAPTDVIDGILYTSYAALQSPPDAAPLKAVADVVELSANPSADAHPVAGMSLLAGNYLKGLTRDDAGGLRYLLNPTNFNYEYLPAGVRGAGGAAFVNGAWRAGVDKLTFLPQPVDTSGAFRPWTNSFTDTFLSNNLPVQQALERVTVVPDFLFTAGDTLAAGLDNYFFTRTGTSGWQKLAAENGDGTKLGPGVIRAPVNLRFNRLGDALFTWDNAPTLPPSVAAAYGWGSFDGSTNPPVAYPLGAVSNLNTLVVHLKVSGTNGMIASQTLQPPVACGGNAALKISHDLVSWQSTTVTNTGRVLLWQHAVTGGSTFFQVVPQ